MPKWCIGTMFVSPTLHQILSQRIDSIRSMARCGESVLGRAHIRPIELHLRDFEELTYSIRSSRFHRQYEALAHAAHRVGGIRHLRYCRL